MASAGSRQQRRFGDPMHTALAAVVRRVAGPITNGRLHIDLPSGRPVVLEGPMPGREADLAIHSWGALRRIAMGGATGLAESYRDGDCSTSDLAALLTWAIDNSGSATALGDSWRMAGVLDALRHRLRTNTRRNSRRNISAHYDLGNAFYAAWLDADMHYSSALFSSGAEPLEVAQCAKVRRIVDLLGLQGGERVLEIGCGWGALAEHLIGAHGCRVTGLTLSSEQRAYAAARLEGRGYADCSDIRLQDYRDVDGSFERIVSIEMLEAVGESYWPRYFATLRDRLVPGGCAVLQAITIDEDRYASYRARPDFIQMYIFPGGMLPTKTIIGDEAARAGLTIHSAEHFGASYALTLCSWRERFNSAWPGIAALAFDERFRRLWNFYLTYCQAGFEAGWLDVGLYRLARAE